MDVLISLSFISSIMSKSSPSVSSMNFLNSFASMDWACFPAFCAWGLTAVVYHRNSVRYHAMSSLSLQVHSLRVSPLVEAFMMEGIKDYWNFCDHINFKTISNTIKSIIIFDHKPSFYA